MGQGSHEPLNKIVNVVSAVGGGSSVDSADVIGEDAQAMILPIVGIAQAKSADTIGLIPIGSRLFLEMDGSNIEVRWGTHLLGWLGGNTEVVVKRVASIGPPNCFLHDIGGGASDSAATVEIYL